ncbi:MAG TPA: hypothetical protein VJM34_13190 [Novosphingobium sp.]|nr:hypothetical protein [Novosphingobium sp.]
MISKIGAAVVAVTLLPALGMVVHWQGGPAMDWLSGTSAKAVVPATLGGLRDAKLAELSRLFVSRDVGVSAGMRAGSELAPVGFLNGQLERQGANWRVRGTTGLKADIYEIS